MPRPVRKVTVSVTADDATWFHMLTGTLLRLCLISRTRNTAYTPLPPPLLNTKCRTRRFRDRSIIDPVDDVGYVSRTATTRDDDDDDDADDVFYVRVDRPI